LLQVNEEKKKSKKCAERAHSMLMASDGQASTHVLHSVHFSLFTTAISSSSKLMASSGHSSTQVPQLTHSSRLTTAGIIESSNFAHWQIHLFVYPIYTFR
jgi:hypothetical protein